MTTVVAQPYSTEGNGGRKLVRLSNGWLIAVVIQNKTNVYIYKSIDNGGSWSQLTSITGPANLVVSASIVAHNDDVKLLVAYSNITRLYRINATTGSAQHTDISGDNTSPMNSVTLAIDPTNGHLHAAWSSKNSNYPNGYNIRYAKSIDGGTTWNTVEHLTKINYTHVNFQNPSIVVKNGNPIVIFELVRVAGSAQGVIFSMVFNGTTWSHEGTVNNYGYTVYGSMDYSQSKPSAVVDKDGVIHVVWEGLEPSNGSPHAIYRRSLDGGVRWKESVIRLPSGNNLTANSITVDRTGRVVICGVNLGTVYSFVSTDNGVSWPTKAAWSVAAEQPSTLYDAMFSGTFGDVVPIIYKTPSTIQYKGTYNVNRAPVITVGTPTNNQTLYENDTFNINGTAVDTDNGNTVTVRYQINALTTRAIKAFLSDGSTLEAFSKTLTFKNGNLYDGTTLIAENLSDGVAHTLKVWATDDQSGTSVIKEIPFYVVPNRAPLLTVNAPVISGLINSDTFTVNGAFEDSDGNNTIISYRLNGASSVQVAEGVVGPFTFEVTFGQLVIGANEIVIEAVDSYGAKVSKTVKLNKAAVETPLLKSTARYKINPPTGSARGVLLWIQRDENLDIDVAISMTMQGEAESFVPLAVSNSAPLDQNSPIVEDEFYHEADSTKDNIILQIDMERASLEVSDKIYLISGVLD